MLPNHLDYLFCRPFRCKDMKLPNLTNFSPTGAFLSALGNAPFKESTDHGLILLVTVKVCKFQNTLYTMYLKSQQLRNKKKIVFQNTLIVITFYILHVYNVLPRKNPHEAHSHNFAKRCKQWGGGIHEGWY